MENRRLFVLVASLFLLAATVFAQTGRVEGIVQLPNHAGPAVGATVVLFRAPGDSLTTVSGDSGQFVFDSARVGHHDIKALLTGYLTAHGDVFIRAGQTTRTTLFLLPIPTGFGHVVGMVQLPNHAGPAVGATVVLFRARGDSLVTMSDDSGHFAFDSARVGRHDIKAILTGYQTAHAEVLVPDGGTGRVTLFLLPIPTGVGRVVGTVVLPNQGGPAVGALVVLFRARGDSLTTTSDDSGHFAFDSARVGEHDIYASLTGYQSAHGEVRVPDGGTARVTLFLRPIPTGYGRVIGSVVLPNHGGPAVGTTVILFRARGDSLVTMSDDSGRFAFDSARVGEHDIKALLTGYIMAHAEVRVPDGGTARITLFLRALPTGGGTVTGTVLKPDATPAADAMVWLSGNSRHDMYRTGTDSLGHFTLPHVQAGHYIISALAPPHSFATASIQVADSQVTDVTLVLSDSANGSQHGFFSENSPDPASVPVASFMTDNYPNPFNPVTTIRYSIPEAGNVKLAIYDVMGREVAVLVNSSLNAGTYSATWNGSNAPSGVYFYRLTAGHLTSVHRMLLTK